VKDGQMTPWVPVLAAFLIAAIGIIAVFGLRVVA
jgi:hypothetical protein